MSDITRRGALSVGAAALGAAVAPLPRSRARAQAANTIKIAVLGDFSGPYRDLAGPGGLACAQQAVAEFADRGFNIEVVFADHQNKPDVGTTITRQWIDRDGVDVVLDGGASSVALAVSDVMRQKNKVYLNVGSASSDLTGTACSPNLLHWTPDTYMLTKSVGSATVRAGGDSWFFITANYTFGHALERDITGFITAGGGRVLGAARYPFPTTTDFSSFLVQAQASGAKIIGLANSGGDTINCVKQAAEFGLTRRGTKVAALLMYLPDVHSLGLDAAQGLICTETYYWDLNDRTRAFARRVDSRMPANIPLCSVHVDSYSAVLHYLKTVADMGVAAAKADGAATAARMKAMPCDDDCFGPGRIREDGRKLHPAYLFEVKKPEESRGRYDYLKLLQTTPAEEAFRPLSEGGCPLVRI
jgi:branched-chain amino acid transport system substrate-binding protein